MDFYTDIKKLIIYSPSNIALIKYWGKIQGKQIPMNPSLSFTLSNCRTKTSVSFEEKGTNIISDFTFLGKENEVFKIKTEKYFQRICKLFNSQPTFSVRIESENSFPHSSGIASSASSFASLSFIAFLLIKKTLPSLESKEDLQLLSSLAREGSGSACRSIRGGVNLWGACEEYLDDSNNEFSINIPENNIKDNFKQWKNNIIIVSANKKEQSSTAGHQLMENHFYRSGRINQSKQNLTNCLHSLKDGNLKEFGEIIENEALSLHGLMMSSYPSFTLLKPNSLFIIEQLRRFREINNCHLFFTIDAGPNIHILFPANEQKFFDKFKILIQNRYENIIEDEISTVGSTYEVISKMHVKGPN
ncbi:diphosphomevalonate decarboxylase [Bacteriovoracaceae bacterium]|nr:diphosphomevalonate decarboxylase [Bacteriovoracaceae bacterium]